MSSRRRLTPSLVLPPPRPASNLSWPVRVVWTSIGKPPSASFGKWPRPIATWLAMRSAQTRSTLDYTSLPLLSPFAFNLLDWNSGWSRALTSFFRSFVRSVAFIPSGHQMGKSFLLCRRPQRRPRAACLPASRCLWHVPPFHRKRLIWCQWQQCGCPYRAWMQWCSSVCRVGGDPGVCRKVIVIGDWRSKLRF